MLLMIGVSLDSRGIAASIIVVVVIGVIVLVAGFGYFFITQKHEATENAPPGPHPENQPSENQIENALPENVGLNFTADSGTRITGGSVPCMVQLPSGVYRLFYTYNGEIYSASSTDGLNFTVDPSKRVTKGGTTDPDRDSAGNPVLIQFGENSFVLFYEGASESTRVVLSATSTDGLNFTKQSGIRYSGTSADGGIVSAFDIIKESETLLRMYYVGDWLGKNNIRTAVSTNGGNTWTFERGNICGDDNVGGGPNTYVDPDIMKLPSGGYKLYVKKGADKIYSFSSTDGLTFTQDGGVRLQASQFSSLGVTQLLDPDTFVFADGSMRMFLGAMEKGIVSASATA